MRWVRASASGRGVGREGGHHTSAGDTGTAWEGPGLDGYQLWEDTVFPEVLAPDSNDAVADGEVGELVATDIDNRATPYIRRFRSGDLCVSREPSSIGRDAARMWVSGRAGDETIVAARRSPSPTCGRSSRRSPSSPTGCSRSSAPPGGMQRLRLRIGYAPERTSDVGELEDRITKNLASQLGVGVDAAMLTLEDILKFSSSVAKFPRTVKNESPNHDRGRAAAAARRPLRHRCVSTRR